MSQEHWIEIAKTLSTVSFGGLMVLIIIAGYYQIWVWGRQLIKAEEREQKAVETAKFWQGLYLERVSELEKIVERLTTKSRT